MNSSFISELSFNLKKFLTVLWHFKGLNLIGLRLPVERVLDIWCFLKDCSLAEADQIINLIFYDFLEPFYIFKLEGLNCDTSEGRIKFILE